MNISKYGGKRIGIIGAGISGLHLGLRLRQLGIHCTVITDRTPAQVASGQLANTVVHWPATLGREAMLGIDHWSPDTFGFDRLLNVVQTPQPIHIPGRTKAPARAIDYRVYLPRLMADFSERGGELEVVALNIRDIGRIAERFDLVVVATPGSGFADLFPRDPAFSPFERPQRVWLAGLFVGIRGTRETGACVSISPGRGEAVQFPILGCSGMVGALAVSSPDLDELAPLARLARADDRAGFRAAVLQRLEQLHPLIYERIDTARFDLQGPSDLVHVALTPVVRQPIAHLGGRTFALALGDAHVTVDPLLGQGANVGSYSALVLAEAIAHEGAFDLEFCREVERCRAGRVLGASRWTNAFLLPPDEARMELLVAMSQNGPLADEYFDNFNWPERQWAHVCSADAIRSWLSKRGLRSPNEAVGFE